MNFNLMYSNSHITMGTSSDDLFEKTGQNQNSLHYKYNKFLISPYLERKYNNYSNNSLFENQKNNELNNNTNQMGFNNSYDSFGETSIYYPKPNYYNNIYTQRYSKRYKKYYNNNYNNISSNYIRNNSGPYQNYNHYQNIISRNNKFKNGTNANKLKTPEYQIKKEIQIQKTPDKYNNYQRYDDYYHNSANKNRSNYNPSMLSQFAENNFINQKYNKRKEYSSPFTQDLSRKIYL